MRLENKVAIITGGSRGLGEATVKRFLTEGAKITIADMDEKKALELVKELDKYKDKLLFVKTDVSNIESVNNMVNKTLKKFNKIDILINNAGITDDATLSKMSEEQFDKVINVNLKGVFNTTKAVIPYMIDQNKGKIINTSSVSGVYGNFGQTNYAASKAAVVGMTKTWAKELGRKGININAVAPGFIKTEMVAKMPEKVIEKMESKIPQGRLGDPTDIANAYLYLASEESNYVNGHTLHVDGGIMM